MSRDEECVRGHALDEENAYHPPNGNGVICRKCVALHARAYRERNREVVRERDRVRKRLARAAGAA